MKLFKNFLKIWAIGTISSFIPYLWVSAIFGAPAVFVSSIIVTLIFHKELS
jgi:hypothetical protein